VTPHLSHHYHDAHISRTRFGGAPKPWTGCHLRRCGAAIDHLDLLRSVGPLQFAGMLLRAAIHFQHSLWTLPNSPTHQHTHKPPTPSLPVHLLHSFFSLNCSPRCHAACIRHDYMISPHPFPAGGAALPGLRTVTRSAFGDPALAKSVDRYRSLSSTPVLSSHIFPTSFRNLP